MSVLESAINRSRANNFRSPSNPVFDDGIDLKRKKVVPINVEPFEVPVAPPLKFKPRSVPREVPTLEDIFEETGKFYRVSKIELRADLRTAELVRARWMAIYLCRQLTLKPNTVIARALLKDHTTILHAAREMARLVKTDQRLADEVQLITICVNERVACRNLVYQIDMFESVDIREW